MTLRQKKKKKPAIKPEKSIDTSCCRGLIHSLVPAVPITECDVAARRRRKYWNQRHCRF